VRRSRRWIYRVRGKEEAPASAADEICANFHSPASLFTSLKLDPLPICRRLSIKFAFCMAKLSNYFVKSYSRGMKLYRVCYIFQSGFFRNIPFSLQSKDSFNPETSIL
jgi:hypothetical protein